MCASPEEEELRIALHTLMARELTGTGKTDSSQGNGKERGGLVTEWKGGMEGEG